MGKPGRKPFELDAEALLDMMQDGFTHQQMAKEFGVSRPTLEKTIARLNEQSAVLLNYRTLQTLELTELQHKILANITDDKIDKAPLRDLVLAYKILKEKEFMVEGKPTEVKGLVHYLVEIERLEAEEKAAIAKKALGKSEDDDVTDAEILEENLSQAKETCLVAGVALEDIP